jgi:transmembrane protein EpsG
VFMLFYTLLVVTAGMRVLGPSADTASYIDILNGVEEVTSGTEEIAFQLIRWVDVVLFGTSIDLFFVVFAVIGVGVKLFALIKHSRIPALSLVLYLLSYYWLHEYVQIRAGVATGIFLLAINDLAKGDINKYLIKATVAILFHWSSVILLPLYFVIRGIKMGVFYWLPVIGMLFFAIGVDFSSTFSGFFQTVEFMDNYYAKHSGQIDDINPFNLITLSYVALFYFCAFVFLKKRNLQNEFDTTIFKIFSFSLFLFFLMSSMKLPVIAFRVSEYLNVVLLLLIPAVVDQFKQKIFLSIIFVGYFMFYTWFLFMNVHVIPDLL